MASNNRPPLPLRNHPMIKRNKPFHPSNEYNSPQEEERSLLLEEEALLPGLPNHLSQLCLNLLPPSLLFSVCHSWRRLLYSPSYPPFYSLYAFLSPQTTQLDHPNSTIQFSSLDHLSSTWRPLPTPPRDPPLHLLHRHPSFLSRNLPIQSLTVSNHLVLVAGTSQHFSPALSKPLVFHPETNCWFFGPPFTTPRRWCTVGSVGGTVFLASGVGTRYCGEVARSMEQWELTKVREFWKWEKLTGLKDGRFCREAVEAIGYKGKLCMVNVKGNAVKEGLIYNPKKDQWEEMPMGMLAGWNGPAAAMDEEAMYVVDEVRGTLSEYDGERDRWEELVELPELRQAEQITAGRGKICVVLRTGERVVVVDVVARPARVWMVEPPCGMLVVGVHILPRLCVQDQEVWACGL